VILGAIGLGLPVLLVVLAAMLTTAIRCRMCSPTRIALAIAVSAGLTAPMLGAAATAAQRGM
jgi:hypothetical protein